MTSPAPSPDALYATILVTLDTRPTDRAIIEHVKRLARAMGTRRVVLLHVADGWAARSFGAEAVTPEIPEDTAYLHSVRDELAAAGVPAEAALAYGEPVAEIVKWVQREGCDLVAMSTHGHRFLGDLFFGTTAFRVQHEVRVPVLLLRAT